MVTDDDPALPCTTETLSSQCSQDHDAFPSEAALHVQSSSAIAPTNALRQPTANCSSAGHAYGESSSSSRRRHDASPSAPSSSASQLLLTSAR